MRPEPFVENTDALIPAIEKDSDFSTQHFQLASQLFSWNFKAYTKDVQIVDPYLLKQIIGEPLNEGDAPGTPPEVFEKELKSLVSSALLVLLPVHSDHPAHWCLLSGSREELSDDFVWRYRDTLKAFSKEALQNAQFFAEIISGPSAKFEKIPCLLQKGSTCGFWTLAYAEVEVCSRFEGPASRGWIEDMVKAWIQRVKGLWIQLQKEEVKLLQVKIEAEGKQEKLRKQQEKELEKAKKILEEVKDFNSAQAKKASESLLKNSQFFRPKDLSEDAKLAILKASAGLGVCSRCRWSSGCLSCSAEKALQHYCKVEAHKLQKVPKISGL